jgi:hypothetical protein
MRGEDVKGGGVCLGKGAKKWIVVTSGYGTTTDGLCK